MSLISIVMPAYNSAKYIEQAILSVLNQTHKNFELLICDDSSSDNTLEIINKYIAIDKRIISVTNNFRKGAAGARNSCLALSRGEFICFLDSDDYWSDDKLELQYLFMTERKIDFSYSNYFMFSDDFLKEIKCRDEVDFKSMTYSCDIGCLTVMLSRTLIENNFFPYSHKEDYAFWLLLLKGGAKAYNLNKTVAFYRRQSNSISGNKIKEVFKQYHVLKTTSGLSKPIIMIRLISYAYRGVLKHYISNKKNDI